MSFNIAIDSSTFPREQYLKKAHNRNYIRERVKCGWADTLFDFICSGQKVNCAVSFKHSYVDSNSRITFDGICKECDAEFKCETNSKHSQLKVNVKNYDSRYEHAKRRHLKGKKREKVAKKLKNQTAFQVHRELAGQAIQEGDKHVPANLPKVDTLRNVKYEASIENGKSALETILKWKNSSAAYRDTIFDVSISPFAVNYHLPIQREFYLTESRHNKMAISIDATGSIVKPPQNSEMSANGNLKHVFLYRVMLKTNGVSIPIFQMISQKHSARFIGYWLEECFNKMPLIPSPAEVVCDGSKALLLALVKTFTKHHTLKEYVAACIRSLETGCQTPSCYIRLDRSHYVKTLIRNIADKDERKRDLFRSIFGYLILCDDFEEAKRIITDLFTVLSNKFIGSDHDGDLPSQSSLRRLQLLSATHQYVVADDGSTEDESEEKENWNEIDIENSWLQDIIANVPIIETNNNSATNDNAFYGVYEIDKFVKILATIPLWSNIMNEKFDSSFTTATSQDVESNFKTLKHQVLSQKMIRADKFLHEDISYLRTEFKLRIAEGMKARSTEVEAVKGIGRFYFISFHFISAW